MSQDGIQMPVETETTEIKIILYEFRTSPEPKIPGYAPENPTVHACLPGLIRRSREGLHLIGRVRPLADWS